MATTACDGEAPVVQATFSTGPVSEGHMYTFTGVLNNSNRGSVLLVNGVLTVRSASI